MVAINNIIPDNLGNGKNGYDTFYGKRRLYGGEALTGLKRSIKYK